jgi:1-deoxy-D-xylulose-5-phosphate reductoisomerase
MKTIQAITILGATGSIGKNTLDVIALHPHRFTVFALTANQNVNTLFEQCLRHKPHYAVMQNEKAAAQLTQKLQEIKSSTQVLVGAEGLSFVATHTEVTCVMAAIVGAAGLLPTLAAANAGKRVLLANKESLVMSGRLFMEGVKNSGAVLLPIDSEHNAIFQCLPAHYVAGQAPKSVSKIMLTASGGPFLNTPLSELLHITPDQACAHPNWVMGRKISVDSATMMNKGLELIEACWLFGVTPNQIEIVIHPQSVVHSLVAYNDGSVLAELGNPDMRTPIAYGLGWPERIDSGVAVLDLVSLGEMTFAAPDKHRFPCLQLAVDAFDEGDGAMVTLNAANEVAVQAFLEKRIRFTDIAPIISAVLEQNNTISVNQLDDVLAIDAQARIRADEQVLNISI